MSTVHETSKRQTTLPRQPSVEPAGINDGVTSVIEGVSSLSVASSLSATISHIAERSSRHDEDSFASDTSHLLALSPQSVHSIPSRNTINVPAHERPPLFTFSQLYNVTPRPSPGPEEKRPRTPDFATSLGSSYGSSPPDSISPLPRAFAFTFRSPSPSASLQPRNQESPQPGPSPSPDSKTQEILQPNAQSSNSSIAQPRNPYNVNNEKPPNEPFFHPDFQRTLQKGISAAKKLADTISSHGLFTEAGPDLQRLQQTAQKLGKFQSSATRTIAVLGDSGEGITNSTPTLRVANRLQFAGKSSLINSLLHCSELAKTVSCLSS